MVDAREYHVRTNHTPEGLRDDDFRLDHANRPRPYKRYVDLPVVELSGDGEPPTAPALSTIATSRPNPSDTTTTGEPDLHALCRYAGGVMKTLERQGRPVRFRAAACTGKLYHVDLYAVTGDLGELDAGVYHYDPHEDRFDVLREGDHRGVLAAASGGQSEVAEAPVTVVATSEWWRNAWKYRTRTYRHAFWDSGTILANLLAVAHAGGHRAEVVVGFADEPVVELLGLDPDREAPLELVPIGSGDPAPEPPPVEDIDTAAPRDSEPVDYPLVPDAWRQSRLADSDAASAWRASIDPAAGVDPDLTDGDRVALDPVDDETASARPVATTIERRGSLRQYAHEPISARMFATVLDRALRGIPTDAYSDGKRLVQPYVLVHAVDDIEMGAYRYHPEEATLVRIGDTDRETAGRLALGQTVVGNAAANVYLMADVETVVDRLGNRGYRLVQLEAGIALGRLYLATYAHRRLGGRGFTFFDELVADHLSPDVDGRQPMTLFAFGTPREG